MRPYHSFTLAAIINLIGLSLAQFPPTPKGVTKIPSKYNNGIYISYKEVCSS